MMEVSLDDLHATTREVAEVVGVDAALALVREIGGRPVYIPDRIGSGHWITALIGPDRAKLLAHRFGQVHLTLPMEKPLLNKIDVAKLHGKERTVPQIATALNMTNRGVRKIIRKLGLAAARAETFQPPVLLCPTCGRRRHVRVAKDHPRHPDQLVLPLP